MKNKKLFIIQINEVNFDLVKKYVQKYNLPNLKKIINDFNCIETLSETKYENLEPWIQWVSFYTGKSADEHKVFHLNDTDKNMKTFYNEIESSNKLAFMFPMNLKNNFKDVFFLPDPWSDTNKNTHSKLLSRFYDIVKNLILQNQNIKLNLISIINIILVFFKYTSFKGKIDLFIIAFTSIFKKYYKAIFLDYLIAEIFINITNKIKTDINTIFLNAAAHIQHHFLLSSEFYKEKYYKLNFIKKDDPVLECYKAYDKIVGKFLKQKNANLFFATGLSQVVIDEPIFYWNLKNHDDFFSKIGIPFSKIEKRMSRDYTLYFNSENDMEKACIILKGLKLNNNEIFSLKKIENKIYLELVYKFNISKGEILFNHNNNIISYNFLNELNFIAVKNSIHCQKGYVFTDLNFNIKETNIKNFYNYFKKKYA